MRLFSLCLGLTALSGHAAARKPADDPPPEVLNNLEFFVDYGLIKQLDALNAAESASKAPAGHAVRVATDTARGAAPSVQTSTATQGKRK